MTITKAETLCESLNSDLIRITLADGPDPTILWVHQKLLCSVSGYFSDLLSSADWDPSDPYIYLQSSDCSTATLKAFVGWIYQRTLKREPHETQWTIGDLFNLYLFAESKSCPMLMNDMMDTLQDTLHLMSDTSAEDFKPFFQYVATTTAVKREGKKAMPMVKFWIAVLYWSYFETKGLRFGSLKRCLGYEGLGEAFEGLRIEVFERGRAISCPVQRGGESYFDVCYFHVHSEGEVCNSQANKIGQD